MTVSIEVKKVKLSTIKLNPDNPRKISETDMDLLVQSIRDFPEMMQLREIVVDEKMTVLGGNMRTLALRKMGEKTCVAKIIKGLTPEQKREFIIKDNGAFGAWDVDTLLKEWSEVPLADWGAKIPELTILEESESSGAMRKNFMDGKGQDDDTGESDLSPGRYPVTAILDQDEFAAWIDVKKKLGVRDDKSALLKLIGGRNA